MIRMQRTVTTAAPAEVVFDYLADFTNAEHWDPNAQSVTRRSGDGGVGTEYRVVSTFAGRTTELDYQLIESDPTTLIRLRGEKKAVTAVDTITVATTAAGTVVCYAVAFDFHGAFGWIQWLLRPAVRRLLDDGADGLQRELDALG